MFILTAIILVIVCRFFLRPLFGISWEIIRALISIALKTILVGAVLIVFWFVALCI